ncbi:MAG: family 43 glycosylhydrolase [Sphingomicrobium sp.]
MHTTRRAALTGMAAGSSALPGLAAAAVRGAGDTPRGQSGIEGQRKADLGNGMYLNPIIAGDHADPTVLKDGDDYYMTFSSFDAVPGIVIWHSKDLVNWAPVTAALRQPLGQVWAMDLIKHKGRYYIYIPGTPGGKQGIFVIWADNIRGPWSEPVDLKLPGQIDPGHIVGEDGKRYLFVNGIKKIGLTDDGLATVGKLEMAYEPWRYPKDWVVEMFAPEGPKLLRHGDYFYLISAVGGTSGPPTSHMVIAARSKSVHGPWEHCPYNPLVRTKSADEPWWSRGHASLVEGPRGDWWMIYHAYENGFRTFGRQAILEPVEWTADGWFRAKGGDLSRPLRKPSAQALSPAGFALSDDFSRDTFGIRWSFHNPAADEMKRVRFAGGNMLLAGKGGGPADSSPISVIAGDRRYEATVTMDLVDGGEGGLLLYYNERAYVGLGFTPTYMRTFAYGQEQEWMREAAPTSRVHIRIRNDANVVTFYYSRDGISWSQHPWQLEVSGLHHNVFGGFLSLKPAIYSAGRGSVRLLNFEYRALT